MLTRRFKNFGCKKIIVCTQTRFTTNTNGFHILKNALSCFETPLQLIDGTDSPRGPIDSHGNSMAPISGQSLFSDGRSMVMEKRRKKVENGHPNEKISDERIYV